MRRALTGFEIEPKQASSSQADYRKSDHRCHRSQSGISELTSEFENCSKVFLFTFDKLLVFFQGLPSWPMLALPPGLQGAGPPCASGVPPLQNLQQFVQLLFLSLSSILIVVELFCIFSFTFCLICSFFVYLFYHSLHLTNE